MWLTLKIFFGFLCVYVIVAGLMAWRQRDIMYFPDTRRVLPAAVALEGFREVEIPTPDGETILAWHRRAVVGGLTIIHYHGNAGSIALRASHYDALSRAGFGVLAVSYRGYGGSTGTPNETGLVADGLAAFDWLAANSEGTIAVYGESLGSGIAVAVAASRPAVAVVLEAPASSILDVARRAYPWLPVELLLLDRFRSDQLIGKVKAPVLMMHGSRDAVIPIDLGRKLYKLANEPKQFDEIEGGGHNDLWEHGAGRLAVEFLLGMSKPAL